MSNETVLLGFIAVSLMAASGCIAIMKNMEYGLPGTTRWWWLAASTIVLGLLAAPVLAFLYVSRTLHDQRLLRARAVFRRRTG